MPTLKDLTIDEIAEALRGAADREVPVTLTVREDDRWVTCRTCLLSVGDTHLLLQMPVAAEGAPVHEFTPAEKAGMSFKLRHHKYICKVTIVGQARRQQEPVLQVCWPNWMQKMQRRAFQRADVPSGRLARAAFWSGTSADEPAGDSPERPVWTGIISNISAGGFQVETDASAAEALDTGEPMGVRLAFGTARKAIYADAQLRHVAPTDGRTMLGFQFVGLGQSGEGRRILQEISSTVTELHRFTERTAGERT